MGRRMVALVYVYARAWALRSAAINIRTMKLRALTS